MPTYKVLGQAAITSTGTTGTAVVTAPGGSGAAASSIVITNTGTVPQTYRICVGASVATLAAANAIVWDASIDPNATVSLALGATLSATDTLYASCSTGANLTITVFGSLI